MAPRGQPVRFQWDGEYMVPRPRFTGICNRIFVVGEVYTLVEEIAPSDASRRHFFAVLREGWESLPETDTRFPSVEHLRKWCLVHTGFYYENFLTYPTAADAKNASLFVRELDAFAVIEVKDKVVRVRRAKSQRNLRDGVGMDNEEFQRSKNAVLAKVSELIGVTTKELKGSA